MAVLPAGVCGAVDVVDEDAGGGPALALCDMCNAMRDKARTELSARPPAALASHPRRSTSQEAP